MPSKKRYNLVHNDEYDTRIPLHSEEAFHRGIVFHAKFIGSMDVPRPTSRVEIVAAMRRIRYEFKAKGIKKKKVTLEVSVDGLKVSLRKKKRKQRWIDENKAFQMHYPIYRIFYVSHDSHDLKIFSYIARDGNSDSFKCNVFKSSKKSQAMRVVRTVGQAFEVCHKLSLTSALEEQEVEKERARVRGVEDHPRRSDDRDDRDELPNERRLGQPRSPSPNFRKDASSFEDGNEARERSSVRAVPRATRTPHGSSTSPIRRSPTGTAASERGGDHPVLDGGETTALRLEIKLLRERLEQQSQQTRAALARARLLQEQLAAETAARLEAQTRTHQSLIRNKELLEHIGALVSHLRDQEHGGSLAGRAAAPPASPRSQGSGGADPSGATTPPATTPPISDLSSLGQSRGMTPGRSSPWEFEPPLFASPFPCAAACPTDEALSSDVLDGAGVLESPADHSRFRARLLERLENLSSRASAVPSFPLSRTSHAPFANLDATASPGGSSPRVNDRASSPPVVSRETSSGHGAGLAESPESLAETDAAAFIKPLPCSIAESKSYPLHAPSVLESTAAASGPSNESTVDHHRRPMPRHHRQRPSRASNRQEAAESENARSSSPPGDFESDETRRGGAPRLNSSFPSVPGSPGPPPSRTTSARLPPRSDLTRLVQRTAWARRTTE